SIELIRRARPEGSPFDQPVLAGQYTTDFRHRDAIRWAAHYKVAYVEPQISDLSADTLALTCWSHPDLHRRRALMKAMYTAIFAKGIKMNIEVLLKTAAECEVTRQNVSDALNGGPASSLHENTIKTALTEGVFGVPTFICDDETFWGNDRLPLLTEHLQAVGNAR
ncbi:MAG: DsbA family protein, partial [Pseudomonadota bacterium]